MVGCVIHVHHLQHEWLCTGLYEHVVRLRLYIPQNRTTKNSTFLSLCQLNKTTSSPRGIFFFMEIFNFQRKREDNC